MAVLSLDFEFALQKHRELLSHRLLPFAAALPNTAPTGPMVNVSSTSTGTAWPFLTCRDILRALQTLRC